MFKMTVKQPTATILAIRTLPVRSQQQLRRELQTQVKPQIEQDVQELVAPYPGPVAHPFQFATDKSRRWYFANFKQRGPYVRTMKLFQSWSVRISSTIRVDLITIRNLRPEATFVFGPRQVPGHARTGWRGPNFQAGVDLTKEHARRLVTDLWRKVVVKEA